MKKTAGCPQSFDLALPNPRPISKKDVALLDHLVCPVGRLAMRALLSSRRHEPLRQKITPSGIIGTDRTIRGVALISLAAAFRIAAGTKLAGGG